MCPYNRLIFRCHRSAHRSEPGRWTQGTFPTTAQPHPGTRRGQLKKMVQYIFSLAMSFIILSTSFWMFYFSSTNVKRQIYRIPHSANLEWFGLSPRIFCFRNTDKIFGSFLEKCQQKLGLQPSNRVDYSRRGLIMEDRSFSNCLTTAAFRGWPPPSGKLSNCVR